MTVNIDTVPEQHPLPRIEDLFAQISGGESFSKLDLQDAYCQLELEETSQMLEVINTHRGLFKFKRLPFGIAQAPAIFQREIEKILQGQEDSSIYIDDLLITGSTEKVHLLHLDKVLTKLENVGAKLKPTECSFLQHSVEYLGH